jgi:hypothetical protein
MEQGVRFWLSGQFIDANWLGCDDLFFFLHKVLDYYRHIWYTLAIIFPL